jgi:hypothetical protein
VRLWQWNSWLWRLRTFYWKWLEAPLAQLSLVDRAPVECVVSASRIPYSISPASSCRNWWCRGNLGTSWRRRWSYRPEEEFSIRRRKVNYQCLRIINVPLLTLAHASSMRHWTSIS